MTNKSNNNMSIKVPDSPEELISGGKYREWRHFQKQAVEEIIQTNGVLGQVQPTGSGKSLTYISAALLTGLKTVILTSTKALQNQIMRDFGSQVKLIMGQNNYPCNLDDTVNCDEGVCHLGVPCNFREKGCAYYDALETARSADIVVTNYHYWMHAKDTLRPSFLIMDEAHHVPEILMDFMTIEFNMQEVNKLFNCEIPYHGEDVDEWVITGKQFLGMSRMMLDTVKNALISNPYDKKWREIGRKTRIAEKLFTNISNMAGQWIVERDRQDVKMFPVSPSKYSCETYLTRGVNKVFLTSATLSQKTMDMLYISPYTFTEYPSVFPLKNRRLFHVKTCQVNHKTKTETLVSQWLQRIDKIIDIFGKDKKGIIHTGSYARQKLIVEHSRHKDIFFHNTRYTTQLVVERFKKAKGQAVLVSPSVTAGFDFPYEQCSYQIIGKLPFPDTRGRVWEERRKQNPFISDYMTAQALTQMCGRGVRAADDSCINFIIDDSIIWWWSTAGLVLCPEWFRESVVLCANIPELFVCGLDDRKILTPMQIFNMRKEEEKRKRNEMKQGN